MLCMVAPLAGKSQGGEKKSKLVVGAVVNNTTEEAVSSGTPSSLQTSASLSEGKGNIYTHFLH